MSTLSTPSVGHDRESPLWRVVMGAEGPARKSIKRLLLTLPAYAVGVAMLLFGVRLGRVDAWQAGVLTAYFVMGLSTFYALLRRRASTLDNDVGLVFPQVLFGIGAVALAYALIDAAKGPALQWLCLILVFDMRRLSRRQVQIATGVTMGLLLTTAGIKVGNARDQAHLIAELANAGLAIVIMPLLVFVSSVGRRYHHKNMQQRAELTQTLAHLKALSIRDGLTGLLTRGHMRELLEEEARRQQRSQGVFCVAILDIDFFKQVNDQFGHAIGDAVLRDFATLAQSSLDPGHALARWGGEEFLVLMPETSLPGALHTLEHLRQAIHQHDWAHHAAPLSVRFSGGVCQHRPGDKVMLTLEHADKALYQAKSRGRDRVLSTAMD